MISPDDFGNLLRTGTDEAQRAMFHRIASSTRPAQQDLAPLLQGGTDSWNGFSALHNCVVAASADGDDLNFFHLLVQQGADVTVRDAEGITLLMLAVQQPQHSSSSSSSILHYLVQELVGRTADEINARDRLGRTALFWALLNKNNHTESVVELLLQHGANPNGGAAQDGTTAPLLEAIQRGKVQTVHLLHQYGADLHVVDRHGNNALHYAVQPPQQTSSEQNQTELVQWLLDDGGSGMMMLAKNRAGKTPLDVVTTQQQQQQGNNNNNNKQTGAVVANLLLQRYQNQIVAQEGDLCLHWILQTAVFATTKGTTTIGLPLGTLSLDQFVALLQGLVTERPQGMRTVDAAGALPLHVACQNTNNAPPPMAVLQFLVDQDRTTVAQPHQGNGNLPLHALLLATSSSSSSLLETVQYLHHQYPAAIAMVNHPRQSPWAVAATTSASVDVLFHLMQAHPWIALASLR